MNKKKSIYDKDIYSLIARMSPMYKPEIVRINISSTFMVKSRCKECGKGPDFYYTVLKPYKWQDTKYYKMFSLVTRRWIRRMLSSWYLDFQPRYFRTLEDFSFKVEDKSYLPATHRTRGANIKDRDNVVEFVGCTCGSTVWAFNDKSIKKRPEITNRKGRYKYPQRFVQ